MKIIENDSVDELLDFIAQHPTFSLERSISFNSPLEEFDDLTPIEYSAYSGSLKCFKYLLMNRASITQDIICCSIAGGNTEIIIALEKNGKQFDYCLKSGVMFHQNEICDWLLSNYKCENVSLWDCVVSYNDETFLFFLFNGANVIYEDSNSSLLSKICMRVSVPADIVDLLLKNGADDGGGSRRGRRAAAYSACRRGSNPGSGG